MNTLLVYPRFPDTFWSFKHAIKFINKKSAYPPLGLLTIAAMLPEKWPKRLVDLNVRNLTEDEIRWADIIFISAMTIQKKSADQVISLCRKAGVKIVAGGPLFTSEYEEYVSIVDNLVLNEAEVTLPEFLHDLKKGSPKKVYKGKGFCDLSKSPAPLWRILNMDDYAAMSIQASRGCPFNCEFCNVTALSVIEPG
jgi:radical SAM superfamily enzyme YgiQ (UPF0313 family)